MSVDTFLIFLRTFMGDSPLLNTRLEQLQKFWNEYDELQVQIKMFGKSEEKDFAHTADRAGFVNFYFRVISKARTMLEANVPNQNVSSVTAGVGMSPASLIPSVQFPKIVLLSCSGNFHKCMTFYDAFKVLVHNNPVLRAMERFHYLSSSLKDEAAQAIFCLQATVANYHAAWKLLQDLYNNKRLIVYNHLGSF